MNAQDLLRKYVSSNNPIPEYQFEKLSSNLKKTYIRRRFISTGQSNYFPDYYIIPYFTEEQRIILIKNKPNFIGYIDNPSEEVQLAAVNGTGSLIQNIKNPSEQVQLSAVQQNGNFIKYIVVRRDIA